MSKPVPIEMAGEAIQTARSEEALGNFGGRRIRQNEPGRSPRWPTSSASSMAGPTATPMPSAELDRRSFPPMHHLLALQEEQVMRR